MEKKNCQEVGHTYGLWTIEENNEACRICQECNFKRVLPINDTILEQIKKQKEANIFLKALLSTDKNNEQVIGYLNVLLDDYINFLDKNNIDILVNKMKELETSDTISTENSMFINYLHSSLQLGNQDLFLEALEKFQTYNEPYFDTILNTNQTVGYHH